MNFIDFINYLITNVISTEFRLITLNEINEKIVAIDQWQKLFFDYELIISLVVYFALFYLIYFTCMLLPFRVFKKLVGQK